jgi:hypothetical protein
VNIFLAGNSGHGTVGFYREDFLIQIGSNRLLSYFWHGENGDFKEHLERWENAKDTISGYRNNRS